jgi:hypothetical protein
MRTLRRIGISLALTMTVGRLGVGIKINFYDSDQLFAD